MIYPGLFKNRYAKLSGKCWLRDVSAEDRQAFAQIGSMHADYGRMGGYARVGSPDTVRDERGRFFSFAKSRARVFAAFDVPVEDGVRKVIYAMFPESAPKHEPHLRYRKAQLIATHSMSCLKHTAEIGLKRGAYQLAWPDHCTLCGGWGIYGTQGGDWVDYGSTRVQLPEEPGTCPQCVEVGCCPRCGEQVAYTRLAEDDYLETCPFCDFEWGVTDGMPPEWECFCYEEQERIYEF